MLLLREIAWRRSRCTLQSVRISNAPHPQARLAAERRKAATVAADKIAGIDQLMPAASAAEGHESNGSNESAEANGQKGQPRVFCINLKYRNYLVDERVARSLLYILLVTI